VAATGDTATTYEGGAVLHRALTGSRLLTLRGAEEHHRKRSVEKKAVTAAARRDKRR